MLSLQFEPALTEPSLLLFTRTLHHEKAYRRASGIDG